MRHHLLDFPSGRVHKGAFNSGSKDFYQCFPGLFSSSATVITTNQAVCTLNQTRSKNSKKKKNYHLVYVLTTNPLNGITTKKLYGIGVSRLVLESIITA